MDRNAMLLRFAENFRLDGDLLVCVACKRRQIASRQDEDFQHRHDCKRRMIGGRPWSHLQAVMMLPAKDATNG